MIIKKDTNKHNGEHRKPYIGPKPLNPSLAMIEGFIKEEIALTKTCGCPHCNFRRHMLRGMQYVIKDYKELIKNQRKTVKK